MRGSSLAWPASLEKLRPFIVTYWSGRTAKDAPKEIRAVIEAAGFTDRHINLALFALDADGKLQRSVVPFIRPPAFRMDPEAQGRDFRRQLDELLAGLELPDVKSSSKPRLTLPDVSGAEDPAGVRIYLTFAANRLNHYRTPTVEAVKFTDKMRDALRYPAESREVALGDLRPMLEQFYPPAIMDGHGGCRSIGGRLTISPVGLADKQRQAILKGTVRIELDNRSRTHYEGPLSLVINYAIDNPAAKSIRGVGTWNVPKHNPQGQVVETIAMTAAIESRPE